METNRVLVIDIETIPEQPEESLRPFLESVKGGRSTDNPITQARKRDENVTKAIEKAALSPVSGKLLCMGIHSIDNPTTAIGVTEQIFIYNKEGDEEIMLRTFVELLKEFGSYRFSFVTFNGRNFDFPFLMFRAAVNKIDLSLPIAPYNGRDNHIDLFAHLNNISNLYMLYDYWKFISLKKWLEYFGIGSKLSISAGDIDLLQLHQAGKEDMIKQYVMNDVAMTYELFKLFRGNFEQGDRLWDSKTY
jgi:DNA polymerase elongation subunit (family B)